MITKQIDKLVVSLGPVDREATLSTLRRIFDNIIQHPNDDKYRQIKLTSKTFSSKVWQYPAGEELMKMSGWVVEDDHVRLRDDSCVQIVSQSLKSFWSSSATAGVLPFTNYEFLILIKALYDGDIPCIKNLLKASHISPNCRIYSESGFSLNFLVAATIAQQIDIAKLLITDYSIDPYAITVPLKDGGSMFYMEYIFVYAPQSFTIGIMKHCGIKPDFKARHFSLINYTVMCNCIDVLCFMLDECSEIDVNVTDVYLYTPLHLAYLVGNTQIAQCLIEHGADVFAVDSTGRTPYEYMDGDSGYIKLSENFQNRRKIYHIPFSIEHCYYMKLQNNGIGEEAAVSLTMEKFPSLKEDGPTQPQGDFEPARASALEEFTQYITKTSMDEPWKQSLSQAQIKKIHVLN